MRLRGVDVDVDVVVTAAAALRFLLARGGVGSARGARGSRSSEDRSARADAAAAAAKCGDVRGPAIALGGMTRKPPTRATASAIRPAPSTSTRCLSPSPPHNNAGGVFKRNGPFEGRRIYMPTLSRRETVPPQSERIRGTPKRCGLIPEGGEPSKQSDERKHYTSY